MPLVTKKPIRGKAANRTAKLLRTRKGSERGALEASTAAEQRKATLLLAHADPSDVKQLSDYYGLRQTDLGRMTGFSLRALADWSAGKLPSEPARRRIHEVRRLLDSLAQVVKPEAIAPWLRQRNPRFGEMTPMQVIEVGEIDRLWEMIHQMSSDSID
ncbi:MAG TPA: hypothetical protein VH370_06545 [Humisphaera sp.]|nr:hypothetical protein [Humisphaera sp.]